MESFFQSQETIAWVERHGFKRVALQLPDALLHLSFTLSKLFESHATSFQTFICADSNYGDCCIDQTTALHNNADCVVHYGLSCLSRPTTLPAFLVFCDLDARDRFETNPDSELLLKPLQEFKSVYVEFDVRYDALARPYFIHQPHVVCAPPPPRELIPSSLEVEEIQQRVDYSLYDAVVFVGPNECAQLDRIALAACPTSQVFSFDFTALTNLQANRALAKRFVLVERVKDAEIVGILVGTMSVAGYASVIAQTKQMIEQAGKKTYVFVFGKLNTAKLANFPHVDAFVLVACPFHSLVSKSFEFNKPIVTPYELQVALADRPWGTYLWDFAQLLAKFDAVEGEEEEVRFSLHTSSIVQLAKPTVVESGKKTTLSLRYESPAAQSLQRAAFQGLDPNDSRDKPPAKAVLGQVGVASRVFQLTDTDKQRPH